MRARAGVWVCVGVWVMWVGDVCDVMCVCVRACVRACVCVRAFVRS